MFYHTTYSSPIGELTLASDGGNIIGLWIHGQKYFANGIDSTAVSCNALPVFQKVVDWLNRYFSGQNPQISELPLAPLGSDFRQQVWKILCQIPYGHVCTYGQIANQIAVMRGLKTILPQAVGNAVGRNPISIIIPCHRVVGTSMRLTGYAAGIDIKVKLLQHEGIDISRMK